MAPDKSERDGAARESRRREWVRLTNLSVIGMVFPVALLLGYFAGRWVGSWFEATRVGGLIGAMVGLVAGFYNLIKMVTDLDSPQRESSADGSKDRSPGGTDGS
jgi:F0F1-type ATP synthase assembly protein I